MKKKAAAKRMPKAAAKRQIRMKPSGYTSAEERKLDDLHREYMRTMHSEDPDEQAKKEKQHRARMRFQRRRGDYLDGYDDD